jgi:hypothetical protein
MRGRTRVLGVGQHLRVDTPGDSLLRPGDALLRTDLADAFSVNVTTALAAKFEGPRIEQLEGRG